MQFTAPTLVCSFPIPPHAATRAYTDKKCPFTGDVSIRGRILTGKVVSTKMTRTIIIRRDYLHYVPKYSECIAGLVWVLFRQCPADRYEKRHKNLAAHVSPAFRVETGDTVTVGEWRVGALGRVLKRLRTMSTVVKDGAVQRTSGSEEQGGNQGVWQVLSGDGMRFIVSCVYACWNEK